MQPLTLPRSPGSTILSEADAASSKDRLTSVDDVFESVSASARRWTVLSWILIFIYGVVILWTFRDYGITWDEYSQSTYGEYIIRWYISLFHDPAVLHYKNLEYYGGFFDVIAQLTTRMSPLDTYETRHLVNALFGFLGVVGAYKIGKYLGGSLAGFLSALFLLLTPRFYGDAFNNTKDIPFACLYLFSMYYLIKAVRYFPSIPGSLILKFGVAVGLTLGIRVGGSLLFGYLGSAFVLWSVREWILQRRQKSQTGYKFGSVWKQFIMAWLEVGAIAYIIMVLWWPAAQVHPVFQPLVSVWRQGHFTFYHDVFFEGRMIPAMNVPRYYVIKWILITLPEFYFIGFSVFLALMGSCLLRFKRRFLEVDPIIEYALLCGWIVFPVALAAMRGSTVYDGLRHFLFIIPPLSIVAGISVAKLCRQRQFKSVRVGVVCLTVISVTVTVVDMVQLHPYEYIFFNRLFGKGVKEAAKSFETEYWGSSYKEGVAWIKANYSIPAHNKKITVVSCSSPFSTSYYLPADRFNYVSFLDYRRTPVRYPILFLATTRWNCNEELAGRVVHIVSRMDTPLLYVKEIAGN